MKPEKRPEKRKYADQKDIEIIDTKRIKFTNEDTNKGEYYIKVSYNIENEQNTKYFKWYNPNSESGKIQSARGRNIWYKEQIINDLKDKEKEDFLIKQNKKVAQKETKKLKNVFYQSFIKIHVIIRYKNNTPFFFPEKDGTNVELYSNNYSEKVMLDIVLGEAKYTELKYWIERAKNNSNISIIGGWTYKRIYSASGSFNGDSVYMNWDEVRFNGTNRGKKINHLARFRK